MLMIMGEMYFLRNPLKFGFRVKARKIWDIKDLITLYLMV